MLLHGITKLQRVKSILEQIIQCLLRIYRRKLMVFYNGPPLYHWWPGLLQGARLNALLFQAAVLLIVSRQSAGFYGGPIHLSMP